MSKNKHDLLLINAKGLKKLVSRTPIYGEPNTNIDVYHSKTGQLIQRKKVGDKGSLNKDIIGLIIIIIIVTTLTIMRVLFVLLKGN